jgi:hypothetical protein
MSLAFRFPKPSRGCVQIAAVNEGCEKRADGGCRQVIIRTIIAVGPSAFSSVHAAVQPEAKSLWLSLPEAVGDGREIAAYVPWLERSFSPCSFIWFIWNNSLFAQASAGALGTPDDLVERITPAFPARIIAHPSRTRCS